MPYNLWYFVIVAQTKTGNIEMNYALRMGLCSKHIKILLMNLSEISKCIKILTLYQYKGIGPYRYANTKKRDSIHSTNEEVTSKYLGEIKCI